MKPKSLHRCETDHNIVAGNTMHRVLILTINEVVIYFVYFVTLTRFSVNIGNCDVLSYGLYFIEILLIAILFMTSKQNKFIPPCRVLGK